VLDSRVFLDAFVAPKPSRRIASTADDDAAAAAAARSRLVLLSAYVTAAAAAEKAPPLPALCRFVHSKQVSKLTLLLEGGLDGGDVYTCDVPPAELRALANRQEGTIGGGGNVNDESTTIRVAFATADGTSATTIEASTWPWRRRNERYYVANACTIKDMRCGRRLQEEQTQQRAQLQQQQQQRMMGTATTTTIIPSIRKLRSRHCLHDWIAWHRIQGVEHFFIYNSNSNSNINSAKNNNDDEDSLQQQRQRNHAWLEVARAYVQQGVVTLIDWPASMVHLSKEAQRHLQQSHAAFAVSMRVDWLGSFDVDAFLLRSGPGQPPINDGGGGGGELVELFENAATASARPLYSLLAVAVPVRNAQHPPTRVSQNGTQRRQRRRHYWAVAISMSWLLQAATPSSLCTLDAHNLCCRGGSVEAAAAVVDSKPIRCISCALDAVMVATPKECAAALST
jgi:hypothetical protein